MNRPSVNMLNINSQTRAVLMPLATFQPSIWKPVPGLLVGMFSSELDLEGAIVSSTDLPNYVPITINIF